MHPPPPARTRSRRTDATSRGRFWTGVGVALAAVGCTPPGPQQGADAVEGLRSSVWVGGTVQAHISYLRAGDPTGPRVILVHGTPGVASDWADYLMQPPPGVEVVALDRPGFGRSGPPHALTGLAEQAAAVVALLPADGRRVVLLGHSLGGPVVARVAADHPSRVQGLVLLAASLDPAQEQIHLLQHVGAWRPVSAMLPRAIRNANQELMALQAELESLALPLSKITARVVIVHGTQDNLVPLANVPYMRARLTGASEVQTVLLEGRNHFLPWNSRPAVDSALRAALACAPC